MKELYHGTITPFETIDVNAGKGYKDFGKGFYATAVVSHAERLALRNKGIAETTTIINDYFDELESSGYAEEICQKVIEQLKPENLPKQYFFRTEAAIRSLSFNKIKRQVVG